MKKLHARELSRNQSILRFDVILQHDWPIEQYLVHIRVFFGGKTKSPCFDLFIHWLIKQMTNTYRNHSSRSYENHSTLHFRDRHGVASLCYRKHAGNHQSFVWTEALSGSKNYPVWCVQSLSKAWLAQLGERLSAEREVAGSNPRPDQHSGGLLIFRPNWSPKCCLCNDICKCLDFLVFSDKDEKPYVPSHSTFTDLFLWGVKDPTSLFEKSTGRRPRWCGQPLRVVWLGGDGTSHGTWVPFKHIPSR